MSDSDDTRVGSVRSMRERGKEREKESLRRVRRRTTPSFPSTQPDRPSWLPSYPERKPQGAQARPNPFTTTAPGARDGYGDPPGASTDSHRTWRIWSTYAKEASEYDLRVAGDWNESMDVLLIFAGLFSSVVTTFLQVSWPWLSPDNASLTARILYASAHSLPLPSSLDPSAPFTPPSWAIRTNATWLASLVLSLAVATYSMLAKSWIREYTRSHAAAAYEQAHARQLRLEAVKSWRMPQIMELLPLLLHMSYALFCWGLVECSFQANSAVVGWTSTSLCAGSLAVYAVFCLLPIWDPECPFRTPWAALAGVDGRQSHSLALSTLQRMTRPSSSSSSSARRTARPPQQPGYSPAPEAAGQVDYTTEEKEQAEARALVWLFENTFDQRTAQSAISSALLLSSHRARLTVLLAPGVLPVLCRMFLDTTTTSSSSSDAAADDDEEDARAAQILRGIDLVYQNLPERRALSHFLPTGASKPEDDLLTSFHTKLFHTLQSSASDELLSAAIHLANVLRRRNALWLPVVARRFDVARLVRLVGESRFGEGEALVAALQVLAHMLSLPSSSSTSALAVPGSGSGSGSADEKAQAQEHAQWSIIESDNLRQLLSVVTRVLKTSSTAPVVLDSALDLVRASMDAVRQTPPGWVEGNQDVYLSPSSGLLSGLLPLLAPGSGINCGARRKVREILCGLMLLSELGDPQGQGVQQFIVRFPEGVQAVVYDFDTFHITSETRSDCSVVHLFVQLLGRNRLRDHWDTFEQAGTLDALKRHFTRLRSDRPPVLLGDAADLLRALLGLVGTVREDKLKESGLLEVVVGDLRDVRGGTGTGEEIRELEGLMREVEEVCGVGVLFIR